MKRKLRSVFFVASFLLAIGSFIVYYFWRNRIEYEIPGDYRGWIIVQYGNGACEALRDTGAFRVIRVPSSGRACTSDAHPDRWTYYKFEYVYPNGSRKALPWNEHGKTGIQAWLTGYRIEDQSEEIFVGDEQAMNHSGTPPASR